ncbi:hypothetical protein E2C01_086439 [Portunus trituberculatus]|uniref:Uncharacterized protein n=1 Tax=Portunus trituberculatus TaxID=210409 RepID=A0A5B7JGB9_PORTR|nr:hypothetical protein [Portunus trituberculatus]
MSGLVLSLFREEKCISSPPISFNVSRTADDFFLYIRNMAIIANSAFGNFAFLEITDAVQMVAEQTSLKLSRISLTLSWHGADTAPVWQVAGFLQKRPVPATHGDGVDAHRVFVSSEREI